MKGARLIRERQKALLKQGGVECFTQIPVFHSIRTSDRKRRMTIARVLADGLVEVPPSHPVPVSRARQTSTVERNIGYSHLGYTAPFHQYMRQWEHR